MPSNNRKSRTAIPGYTLIPAGDHYKVRKISVGGDRVKTDPAFKVTRLNNEVFKKAAGLSKQIRNALVFGTGMKSKPELLTAALIKALSASEAALHERTFDKADFSGMDGYNLNSNVAWSDCMQLTADTLYSPLYRRVTVFLPGFIPSQICKAPESITHARLTTYTLFMQPHNLWVETRTEKTTMLPLSGIQVRPATIINKCEYEEMKIWLVAIGVTWYKPDNKSGQLTPGKPPGPLTIVKMGNF